MEFLGAGLEAHVISTREPMGSKRALYNLAYQFWHWSWKQTFESVDPNFRHLYADEFLRHAEIIFVTSKIEPVGIVLVDYNSLSNPAFVNCSYFKHFIKDDFVQFQALGYQQVMVMSHLAIAQKWRKSISKFPSADILIGLALKRFLESGRDALISFSRNDRKTDHLVKRFGGRPIRDNFEVYKIPSTILAIDRHSACFPQDGNFTQELDPLWTKIKNTHHKGDIHGHSRPGHSTNL